MHAAKIPLTSMIVSSLAVACIMLIAHHIPSRAAILKATVTLAFLKLMLSPHSPPTAYIAVFFQGYPGYVFFNNRRHFLASAITVAILALFESSMQRLMVLRMIYGNTFDKNGGTTSTFADSGNTTNHSRYKTTFSTELATIRICNRHCADKIFHAGIIYQNCA